jgi:competence protein ComEC
MTLITVIVGWLIGLVCGDGLLIPGRFGIALALAGGLAGVIGRRRPAVRLVALGGLGVGLGIARMALAQPDFAPNHIRYAVGQTLLLEGVVADEPRWTPEGQRLTLQVERIQRDTAISPTTGLVLLELPPEPPRQKGERLLVRGDVVAPQSGRGFDYAGYLSRRGIFVTLKKAVLEAAVAPPPSFQGRLLESKAYIRRLILRSLPEPTASLLIGILLGIQSSIPQDVWLAFNRTGTSHILVISGWNISIIVMSLLAIGQRLGWRRWPNTAVALGMIVIYVLFVGATPSVMRAALMGVIVALAQPLGRRADAWTALAAACFLMTAINPQTLWDLGFQLSALATASLFAWGKPIERGVKWLLRPRWLEWMVEPLTATLAAQIWALPIILYNFGNLSLIAPLANILMVPVVPLAMGAGAALAGLGLIWRPLTLLALPFAWCTLAWLLLVADLLAKTAWAAVSLPPFAPGWIIGYYALSIAGWAWMLRAARQQTPVSA